MKIIDYGPSILIQYNCDYPSQWHETVIRPMSCEELYKYLGRYFDNLYVDWNTARVTFLKNNMHTDNITFALSYKTDNLYVCAKNIYVKYENYKLRNNI